MADNFVDNVAYGNSTLSVSGNAIQLGDGAAGAKSIIMTNNNGAGHLAWNPSGNATANIPAGGGTLLVSSQAILSISAGAAAITSGQVIFSNSNGVSFGANGQTITASHNAITSQTNQTVGVYALGNTTAQSSSSTIDARSLSFNGAGNISVGYSAGSIIISQTGAGGQSNQTIGLYALGNTTQNSSTTLDARTLSFNALGAATMGYSNGSIQVSVPVQSAQTQSNIQAIYDGANSISTGTIRFTNANGVSFSINGQTISGSVAAQTNQTIGGYAVGNTTAQSSSTTIDARSLSFQGAGIASVGYSAGSIVVSVPSGAPSPVNFSAGTTSGNLGSVVFSNSNGVSFGLNGSTITASAAGGAGATSAGFFATGNTTQNSTTTLAISSLLFNGLGGNTVGYSNGSIQISAPATSSLVGVGGISLSSNGSTISIIGGPVQRSYIEIIQGERLTTNMALSATAISNRPVLMPFHLEGTGIQANTVRMMLSGVGSSNRSFGGTFSAGLYFATNSTQMTLLGSDSMSFSITASSQSTLWNGINIMDFTGMSNVTLSSEGRYALAFAVAPVSANSTWMSAALMGADAMPQISRFMIANTTSGTNNTSNILPFWGAYSTTTGALPSSIGLTEVLGGQSQFLADVYAIIKQI